MDTTTSALNKAWRLTLGSGSSITDELPISKLLQLLIQLEIITKKRILDPESHKIVNNFINDPSHSHIRIQYHSFKSFFQSLLGLPLQSIIGTPPLNLNQSSTSNFINRELQMLKRQTLLNDDEITYRDQIINDLQNSNDQYQRDNIQQRLQRHKLERDLQTNTTHLSQLSPPSQLLQKLDQQLILQKKLIEKLSALFKPIMDEYQFEQKQTPKVEIIKKPSFNYKSYIKYIIFILILLSAFNFLIDVYDDYEEESLIW